MSVLYRCWPVSYCAVILQSTLVSCRLTIHHHSRLVSCRLTIHHNSRLVSCRLTINDHNRLMPCRLTIHYRSSLVSCRLTIHHRSRLASCMRNTLLRLNGIHIRDRITDQRALSVTDFQAPTRSKLSKEDEVGHAV